MRRDLKEYLRLPNQPRREAPRLRRHVRRDGHPHLDHLSRPLPPQTSTSTRRKSFKELLQQGYHGDPITPCCLRRLDHRLNTRKHERLDLNKDLNSSKDSPTWRPPIT